MNENEKVLTEERENEITMTASEISDAADITVPESEALSTEALHADTLTEDTCEMADNRAKYEPSAAPALGFFQKYSEVFSLAIGEGAVVILTVLGFVIYNLFGGEAPLYKAILGSLLGALVMVGNMLILTVSVNGAIEKYLVLRGTREMTDEEAEEFAKKNGVLIQNAITRSYIIRTALMIGALVGGMFIPVFNVVATVIPLLMYRPLMYISELLKKRRSSK